MATKTIHQLIDASGRCTAPAVSAPNAFVHHHTPVQIADLDDVSPGASQPVWGPMFSAPLAGNAVQFFTTGDAYFRDVGGAISAARSSVFITGWQINHDVALISQPNGPAKTLFECLLDALKNGATVYVMPWLTPPGPIDTGHLMTLLAINLLNAAPDVKGRAHCLTAPTQSDQGTLSVVFSHHQKLVVIDNERAYVGGIDLAYGRRDDGQFGHGENAVEEDEDQDDHDIRPGKRGHWAVVRRWRARPLSASVMAPYRRKARHCTMARRAAVRSAAVQSNWGTRSPAICYRHTGAGCRGPTASAG